MSSYGWHDGDYYRRTYDRSDRSEAWARAEDPSEVPDDYDAGGEDAPPQVSRWIACEDPEGGAVECNADLTRHCDADDGRPCPACAAEGRAYWASRRDDGTPWGYR